MPEEELDLPLEEVTEDSEKEEDFDDEDEVEEDDYGDGD